MTPRTRGFSFPSMNTATVQLKRTGPLTTEDFVAFASGARLQVCRAIVQSAGISHRVTLLLLPSAEADAPGSGPPGQPAADEPTGTITALVAQTEQAQSTVTIDSAHEKFASSVAAAVAVMRASWGWEETPQMCIHVNGTRIVVEPRYSGTTWEATIADAV
jgi:hypothetical protein